MLRLKGDAYKLLKGISFSWIRFGLTIGLGLVQTPLLFKYLPNDQLNSWYLFYSFGAFLQMADLGLTQTISRLIAYIDNSGRAKDDTIGELSFFKIKQIYYTSIVSFLCLIVMIGFIASIVYFNTEYKLFKSDQLVFAFCIYVLNIIFTLLTNIPGAMLLGYRDIAPESIIRSAFQIILFIALFLGLPHYKSIVFISIAFLCQNIGMFFVLHITLYFRHRKVFIQPCPLKDIIKPVISKNIYKQSLPLAINQLGGWLINQGNIIVASIAVTSQNISDYAINQQVFTYIASIALVLNQSIGPFIAKQYIQNKRENIQHFFRAINIFCLTIVSCLLVIQVVCGYEIVNLWVGYQHYLGFSFSCVFAVITFLEVQHSVSGNFVWNTQSWPFNTWTLAAGILNVGLGYVLGGIYGLLGLAVATLMSKLLTLNWYVLYYCLRRLHIQVKSYIVTLLLPILCISIGTFFAAHLFKSTVILRDLSDFYRLLVVSIICFTCISIAIILTFKEQMLKTYKMINMQLKL